MSILPFSNQSSLGLRISVLMLICMLGAAVATFFGLLVSMLIWNLPVDAMQNYAAYGEAGISMMKFTQAFASIGLFVVPPIVYARLLGQKPPLFLKLDQRPVISFIALAGILMAVQLPWINALGVWNNSIEWGGLFRSVYESMRAQENAAAQLIEQFLYMPGPIDLFQTLIIVALIPAIGEEFLFRGVVQPMLSEKRGAHFGVWITAFVFSFIHFQFFGFFPRLLLGAFFGYLYVWNRNIWIPIIAHFFNNGWALTMQYLYQQKQIAVDPEKLGEITPWWSVLISLALVVFYIRRLHSFQIEK